MICRLLFLSLFLALASFCDGSIIILGEIVNAHDGFDVDDWDLSHVLSSMKPLEVDCCAS